MLKLGACVRTPYKFPRQFQTLNSKHQPLKHSHSPALNTLTPTNRSYEQSLLDEGAGGDRQAETVRQLYHRQLQTPQPSAQQLLQEYEEWEKQHGQVRVCLCVCLCVVGGRQ